MRRPGGQGLFGRQEKVRIRWKCQNVAKFSTMTTRRSFPGQPQHCKDHLNRHSSRLQEKPNESVAIKLMKNGLSSLSVAWNKIFRRSQETKEVLPLSTTQSQTLQPPLSSADRLLFLLTCLKLGTAPILIQKNMCHIVSDQDFFCFLRSQWKNRHSRYHSIFTFNKVVKIKFVRFELFPKSLVNILAEDCPPVNSGYIPVKDSFTIFPPISSNIMIHL